MSLRRPTPAFAFVEYADPEAVVRCLQVINGQRVGERDILVKADDKTRERLDEYEASRHAGESHDAAMQRTADAVTEAIQLMARGGAPPASHSAAIMQDSGSGAPQPGGGRTLQHLQDLRAEDLPESSRTIVTSEIAAFRERALKKKQAEEDRRSQRVRDHASAGASSARTPMSSGMGVHHHPHHHQAPAGPPAMASASPPQPMRGSATPGRPRAGSDARRDSQPRWEDPQSYNRPMSFVPSGSGGATNGQANAAAADDGIDDEQVERERLARKRKDDDAAFREREKRWLHHERNRLAALDRERAKDVADAEALERERRLMGEHLAHWDDEREANRARELFYADRQRWRASRRAMRARERDDDARDAEDEARERAALAKQSHDFLERTLGAGAPKRAGPPNGFGNEEEQGIKLSFGARKAAPPKPAPPAKTSLLGAGEDDEEESRKKRELIPLEYSDDEDDSRNQQQKKKDVKPPPSRREQRLREIEQSIPRSRDELFRAPVKWAALTEDLIVRSLAPFVSKTIVQYLEMEEQELVNAVLEKLRAHDSPEALSEEVGPVRLFLPLHFAHIELTSRREQVLDEDTDAFVEKVWRQLLHQTLLADAGLA